MKKYDEYYIDRLWRDTIQGFLYVIAWVWLTLEYGDLVISLVMGGIALLHIPDVVKLVRYYQGKPMDSWDEVKEDVPNKSHFVYAYKHGRYSIRFGVPFQYSWDKKENAVTDVKKGIVTFPLFKSTDGNTVRCRYFVSSEEDTESGNYCHVTEYVVRQLQMLPQNVQKKGKSKQVVLEGTNFVHYYIVCYEESENEVQELYAVCEVEPGKVFECQMTCSSWENKLSVKDVESFFTFEQGK